MAIALLARDNKSRGDLFTKLVSDLFESMGYTILGLNIHRPGREIDITASHCFGGPPIVAECKAEERPIGGAHINKFLGALARESAQRNDQSIQGIFVSLSGFTGTAKAQEVEAPSGLLTYMGPDDVVAELVRANIICADDHVAFVAGQLIREKGLKLKLLNRELLVHRTGILWIQYLGDHGKITHAALVHADGQPASEAVAQDVRANHPASLNLKALDLLHPGKAEEQRRRSQQEALELYKSYLLRECGEIEMTGLSADAALTTRRYPLEQIYVPLKLLPSQPVAGIAEAEATPRREAPQATHRLPPKRTPPASTGRAISQWHQLVVLGDPGSGKSTLLKRITVAYADPQRRTTAADELPDRDWLPIFVRCRQLRGLATRSLEDILRLIAAFAEVDEHADLLVALFKDSLRDGRALLLVDGLDEIPEPGDRLAFCRQLERFSARYPACPFLVTSRLVGYRELGFHLGQSFVHTRVADLEPEDIKSYVQAWYREIENSPRCATERALQVSNEILSNPRILRLAQNPLMLATMTLVRHWLGELPKKRSALYREAVQVLLVNWNREAHAPIDPDEALPQLEFIAFSMMQDGYQQLNKNELLVLLGSARQQMDDVLQHAKYSAAEFLSAVEYRSSLLTETGRKLVDGELVPIYEFRHLTFQEYLAARAAVFGHYPQYSAASKPLDVLKPYVADPAWSEVFPLATVLAGRAATEFIEYLLDLARAELSPTPRSPGEEPQISPFNLAMLCLADEPSVRPSVPDALFDLLPAAFARRSRHPRQYLENPLLRVADSVYGPQLIAALSHLALRLRPIRAAPSAAGTLGLLVARDLAVLPPDQLDEWKSSLALSFQDAPLPQVLSNLLAIMRLAFARTHPDPTEGLKLAQPFSPHDWDTAAAFACTSLAHPATPVRFAAAWALAWLFAHTDVTCPPDTAALLLRRSLSDRSSLLVRQSSWALDEALEHNKLPEDRSWLLPPASRDLDVLIRRLKALQRGGNQACPKGDTVAIGGVLAICSLWGPRAARADLLAALRPHAMPQAASPTRTKNVIEALEAHLRASP